MKQIERIILGGTGKDAPRLTINGEEMLIPWDHIICPKTVKTAKTDGWIPFQFNLTSTRGGGASWKATLPQEVYGGIGRYNTKFKGLVNDFRIWWLQQTRHNPLEVSPRKSHIVQMYLRGYNQFTRELGIDGRFKPFTERISLLKILKKEEEELGNKVVQGNLKLIYIPLCWEKILPDKKFYPSMSKECKQLFNHQFIGGWITNPLRKENIAYALLKILHQKGGWVVSPDHITEARWLSEGWYLISHPIPDSGDLD